MEALATTVDRFTIKMSCVLAQKIVPHSATDSQSLIQAATIDRELLVFAVLKVRNLKLHN